MRYRGSLGPTAICFLLSVGLHYLSAGDRPVGLAVWLAPVLLLRFFRDAGAVKAFLAALAALTAASVLANRGMLPIPSLQAVIAVHATLTAAGLVPYLIEGLARRALPRALQVLLFPSLVVAVPFLRGSDWTYIHPVTSLDDLALLQLASLAGVAGVTFIVSLAAAMANDIWERRRSRDTVGATVAAMLAVLLAVYGFGIIRLRSETPRTGPLVRAAAIVPAPSMRAKLESSFVTFLRPGPRRAADVEALRRDWTLVYQQLLSDSVAAGKAGFDLAVWSEGAAIVFEEDEQALLRQAAEAARNNGMRLGIATLVYMTSVRPSRPGPFPIMVNKLVLLGPSGEVEWEHHKTRLAPGLEAAITIPGDGILKANAAGISGAICYEMDFSRYLAQAGTLGAGLLLAPSNDWDAIKHAHARSARLRAIENGASLVRPAAGGISIAVDAYGRTLARVDNSRVVGAPMTAIVPAARVPTLYVAWGDWLGWLSVSVAGLSAAIIVVALAGRGRRRRENDGERRGRTP
jgi:apolipoprotein N-acyltransferase